MSTNSKRTSATDLRREVSRRIENLSTERLRVANDSLVYLEERESREATGELLSILGFKESL